jgi:hypothetical protein
MKPPSEDHDLIRWLDGEMSDTERLFRSKNNSNMTRCLPKKLKNFVLSATGIRHTCLLK